MTREKPKRIDVSPFLMESDPRVEDFDGSRKGTCPEDNCKVRRVLGRKTTRDLGPSPRDPLSDRWRRVDVLVEHNRQPLVDIICGNLFEYTRPNLVKLKGNVGLAKLGIVPHPGILDGVAREQDPVFQNIGCPLHPSRRGIVILTIENHVPGRHIFHGSL